MTETNPTEEQLADTAHFNVCLSLPCGTYRLEDPGDGCVTANLLRYTTIMIERDSGEEWKNE